MRIKALNLIRKLLELPGQHFAQEYRHVFVELLNRFSDKSAEVRLSALSCAKALYMTNPSGGESVEVLCKLSELLFYLCSATYIFLLAYDIEFLYYILMLCELSSCH